MLKNSGNYYNLKQHNETPDVCEYSLNENMSLFFNFQHEESNLLEANFHTKSMNE